MPENESISAARSARLAELLIEQADAEIARSPELSRLLAEAEMTREKWFYGDGAGRGGIPLDAETIEMPPRIIVSLPPPAVATGLFAGLGDWPIREAYAAGLLTDWLTRPEPIASSPARYDYGPFRNRPKRTKPSAQRRQRMARRIERKGRK